MESALFTFGFLCGCLFTYLYMFWFWELRKHRLIRLIVRSADATRHASSDGDQQSATTSSTTKSIHESEKDESSTSSFMKAQETSDAGQDGMRGLCNSRQAGNTTINCHFSKRDTWAPGQETTGSQDDGASGGSAKRTNKVE